MHFFKALGQRSPGWDCFAELELHYQLHWASSDDDMAEANTAVYSFTMTHKLSQTVWQTKSACLILSGEESQITGHNTCRKINTGKGETVTFSTQPYPVSTLCTHRSVSISATVLYSWSQVRCLGVGCQLFFSTTAVPGHTYILIILKNDPTSSMQWSTQTLDLD